MASYSRFLGRKITVHYRVGDVLIPASGTLVADSGRSIFLEQHLEQRGRLNYFRWEIPYPYIHRLAEISGPEETSSAAEHRTASLDSTDPVARSGPQASRAAAASGASGILPVSHRPKTA